MNAFDEVIGYENVKAELERICDMIKNKEKYEKLGVTIPRGLLLYGVPGVGKSLICKCFIKETGRKAYICRKDKPNGDFVNEIRTKFDEAVKNSPSIVFLDDMDKFANSGINNRNAEEYITIQSCIDSVKDKDVYVIATVNEMKLLPLSLTRAGRFDKNIKIKAPKGNDAVKIVEYYLSKKKNVGDVDPKGIAKILDGRSCAELETVINEAGIFAAFNNKNSIDMDDVIHACMRIIYNAPECLEGDSSRFLREIAYHEAGHAVVSEILEPGSVNIISVLKNEGDIGGITSCNQDEDYFKSIEFMENRVMTLLAGKAASEVKFGKIDVGTINDIRRAHEIVERFVDDYCGYGFDAFETETSSNQTMFIKETKIANEMAKYYNKAKTILIENLALFDRIANMLINKKILTYRDIEDIKNCHYGIKIKKAA